MNKPELINMLNELKKVFDEVRLVDATAMKQYHLSDDGELQSSPCHCYEIWNKQRRCQNCISLSALEHKSRMAKFELSDGHVYSIIAQYIELDGQPYVLEMIQKIVNETLFSAFGKTELIQNMINFSKNMYLDPLTGAYNRLFFEEQFMSLENHCAVAFLDIDRFKGINDTYGHDAGDKALKAVVDAVIANIRPDDICIRYGGEEFVITFAQMPKTAFVKRLEDLRKAVKRVVLEEYPEIKLTISIGGVYNNDQNRMEMIHEADKLCYEAKFKRDDVKVIVM